MKSLTLRAMPAKPSGRQRTSSKQSLFVGRSPGTATTSPMRLAAKALDAKNQGSSGVDWDTQPLGTMSDKDMGALHGVSTRSAKEARERRGIAAYCEQTD